MKTNILKQRLIITTAATFLLVTLPFLPAAFGNIFFNATPTNDNITTGLAGHYSFDGPHVDWSAAGAEILDTSGNSNTGQVVNMGPENANRGKVGQGLDFNGSDEYIDLGNPASLQLSNSFSIAAWIYPRDLTGSKDIVLKTDGTNSGTDYSLQTYNDEIAFQFYNGDWKNAISTGANLPLNEWSHVTGVFNDDADEFRLYLNGNLVNTTAETASPIDTASNVYIGRGWPGQEWNGRLDDIRIYDYALTEKQIQSIHGIGSNQIGVLSIDSITSNLIARWTLNGSNINWSDATSEIKDISGNNYHGDAISLDGTEAISGKSGQALVFDGTNDYIDVGNIAELNNTNKFTITAWIRDDAHSQDDRPIGMTINGSNDLSIATWGNGDLYAEIGNGVNAYGYWSSYDTTIPEGSWYHLAVIYDGDGATNADRLKMYVDGINRPLNFYGTTIPATTADLSAASFLIGNDRGDKFDGALDDIRIYNTNISEAEVLSIYNSAHGSHAGGSLQTTVTNGRVGRWTFDGSDLVWGDTTTEAKDLINSYHGDVKGGMGTANAIIGKVGQALNFDGTDDRIEIANSPSLEPSNVSVQAWVRGGSNVGGFDYILSKGADSCNNGSYSISTDGSGNLIFYVAKTTSTIAISPTFSSASTWDNTWHHVVGTYDGSFVRLYVDGSEVGTGTANSNSIAYGLSTHNNLTIGSYEGSCSLPIDADIDDVQVYGKALSATEIADLYQQRI